MASTKTLFLILVLFVTFITFHQDIIKSVLPTKTTYDEDFTPPTFNYGNYLDVLRKKYIHQDIIKSVLPTKTTYDEDFTPPTFNYGNYLDVLRKKYMHQDIIKSMLPNKTTFEEYFRPPTFNYGNDLAGERKYNSQKHSLTLQSFAQFFDYVEKPRKLCQKEIAYGGVHSLSIERYFDGDKIVCVDEKFRMKRGACFVYSFGINNEWSFDDALVNLGCTVFAFDPTMKKTYNPNGPNDYYKRGQNIYFFPLGLGGENGLVNIGGVYREVRTIDTLIKIIGHKDKNFIIDYLKIDIEGGELPFLKDILFNKPELLNHFKQIGMEIHTKRAHKASWDNFQDFYKCFMELENNGFQLFSSRMNPIKSTRYHSRLLGKVINQYYELVWARF